MFLPIRPTWCELFDTHVRRRTWKLNQAYARHFLQFQYLFFRSLLTSNLPGRLQSSEVGPHPLGPQVSVSVKDGYHWGTAYHPWRGIYYDQARAVCQVLLATAESFVGVITWLTYSVVKCGRKDVIRYIRTTSLDCQMRVPHDKRSQMVREEMPFSSLMLNHNFCGGSAGGPRPQEAVV
jgi:hypothetical protein